MRSTSRSQDYRFTRRCIGANTHKRQSQPRLPGLNFGWGLCPAWGSINRYSDSDPSPTGATPWILGQKAGRRPADISPGYRLWWHERKNNASARHSPAPQIRRCRNGDAPQHGANSPNRTFSAIFHPFEIQGCQSGGEKPQPPRIIVLCCPC